MNSSFLYQLKLYKCWKCHALIFSVSVVKLRRDKDLDNWSSGHQQAEWDEVPETEVQKSLERGIGEGPSATPKPWVMLASARGGSSWLLGIIYPQN